MRQKRQSPGFFLKALYLILFTFLLFQSCIMTADQKSSETSREHSEIETSSYYVAKNGNDNNPGTNDRPFRTISAAVKDLSPGDTLFIKEGIYYERVFINLQGREGNPIVIRNYPGHTVTIDGSKIRNKKSWNGLLYIDTSKYITVTGLTIKDSPYCGIFVIKSQHIVIFENLTDNTYSSGIGVWMSENVIIDENEVVTACNGGSQECITVAVTDGFSVRSNHVHGVSDGSNGGEGIDVKDGSRNGKVYNNYVHHTSRLGIYVDAWDKHTYNIEVYNNIVHDCNSWGIALAAEKGGLLENVKVYNNISYNNIHVGIGVEGVDWGEPGYSHPMKDIFIYNNSIFHNGTASDYWGVGIRLNCDEAENVTIVNNIISDNLTDQILIHSKGRPKNLIINNNILDGATPQFGENPIIGPTGMLNPEEGLFNLTKDSPAIDRAIGDLLPAFDIAGNIRPVGKGVDIGAYEFVE